ncbi:MAG: LbtU family siderophore porin [Gammaproteobacteria bacterium]|nr:MAG: LbtU family siderophore porin [Gammaproteobacteria bacterium]
MRFKLIIFSLLALGVSCPAFAAGIYVRDSAYEQEVMREQVNKMDWLLGRNQPGGFDQPCGWKCRINLSGWMNTDAYITNTPPVFLVVTPFDNLLSVQGTPFNQTSNRASDLLLNNANLFVDTRVNNWMKANMSFVYTSLSGVPGSQGVYQIPNSFLIYQPVNSSKLDTAYATLQHFNVSPVYLRIGKEYVPFGNYDPYSFVTSENPTQLLSTINATTAQLGFTMPSGLYGSIYTFAGQPRLSDGGSTRRIQNGGVNLGYTYSDCISRFNIDAGYVASITDTNFLSAYYTNKNIEVAGVISDLPNPDQTNIAGLPNQKTPAYNINASFQWGPLDVSGQYIATIRNFRKPFFLAFPVPLTPNLETDFTFQKPKLWGFELGLTFAAIANQTRLAVGYQATKHLAGILPNRKIYVDYLMNISQWFDVGVAIIQNKDYSLGEGQVIGDRGSLLFPGASGNKSTMGQIRASIKFA